MALALDVRLDLDDRDHRSSSRIEAGLVNGTEEWPELVRITFNGRSELANLALQTRPSDDLYGGVDVSEAVA
jgi:hypothetical protein